MGGAHLPGLGELESSVAEDHNPRDRARVAPLTTSTISPSVEPTPWSRAPHSAAPTEPGPYRPHMDGSDLGPLSTRVPGLRRL